MSSSKVPPPLPTDTKSDTTKRATIPPKQSYADKPLDATAPATDKAPLDASVTAVGPQNKPGTGELNIDTSLLGNPATGGPLKPATGAPPATPAGTSTEVLDPSLADHKAMLDRMADEQASLRTPEIHKQALRKADAEREHGAPATLGAAQASTLAAYDQAPRTPVRVEDEEFLDYREVTVKLGAPAEADYVTEGAVVSHVNSASGEVTFRVNASSNAFNSVRARQIVKNG